MKCNICQKDSEFLPFGNPPRQKARCPICGSLERHRFLWSFLPKELGKILHFAPERCLYNKFKDLDYISVDLYPESLRVPAIKADITALFFENDTFDTVICSHVLEHIESDRLAIAELYRVLRKGGTLYVQVPLKGTTTYENPLIKSEEERVIHFGQKDHVRWYGTDIEERFTDVGFIVKQITTNEAQSIIWECRK